MTALQADANAPRDYVEWLSRCGWGDLGEGRYMLYKGLVDLSELAGDAPGGYLSFGDDLSGCSGCFRVGGDGQVHEYDSGSNAMRATGLRFPEFIRQAQARSVLSD